MHAFVFVCEGGKFLVKDGQNCNHTKFFDKKFTLNYDGLNYAWAPEGQWLSEFENVLYVSVLTVASLLKIQM